MTMSRHEWGTRFDRGIETGFLASNKTGPAKAEPIPYCLFPVET
ncbi:hypothetical protein [Terriglobus roseus]|nr:hypothetical protein [Terriglobus roseus]